MKSPIQTTLSVLSAAAAWYFPPGYSGSAGTATETDVPTVVSTGGTISRLFVKLGSAPGAGTSYAFKLRINGADTALTCTIANAATTGSDTSNSVSVSAGDILTFSATPTGSPGTPAAAVVCQFSGTTGNQSLLLSGSRARDLSTTGTEYLGVCGNQASNATETNKRNVIPTGGTIKNLYVKLSAAPGVGTTRVFTLYLNGAPTALTCTVSGGAATTANDTTHTVTVAAGDEVSLQASITGTPAAAKLGFGMTFTATTDGESLLMGTSNGANASDSATNYAGVVGENWQANESLASGGYPNLGLSCSLKKMYVACDTAPGASKSFTFDARVNSASPANDLSVTVTGAATTTGNDTSHTVTVADGDEIDIRSVPASTPTASNYRIGVVAYIAPAAAANGNMLMFF